MKNLRKKFKGFIAVAMVLVMLAGIVLPAAALSVTVPKNAQGDELCYTLQYKDGTLSLVINAEKLYEVMEDKKITKEELNSFLPAEVVDAMQGGSLAPEELVSLISSYISLDDVTEIIGDMPKELVAELFDPELINKIIDIKELLELLPLDDIMAALDDEALQELLGTDGVMDILRPKIIESDIIETVLENMDLTELLKDTEVRAALEDILADETRLNQLLEIEAIKQKVNEYMMGDTVVNNLIAHKQDLHVVFDYITTYDVSTPEGQAKHDKFLAFMTSDTVTDILMTPKFIVNGAVVTDLIKAKLLTVGGLEQLLIQNGKSFSDFVDEAALFDSSFTDKVFSADVLSPELIRDILAADATDTVYPKEVRQNLEVLFKAAVNKNVITAEEILAIDGIVNYAAVEQKAATLKIEDILNNNIVTVTETLTPAELATQLEISQYTLGEAAAAVGITDPDNMTLEQQKALLIELNTNRGVSSQKICDLTCIDFSVNNSNVNWFINATNSSLTDLLASNYVDKILADDGLVQKITATISSTDPEISAAWDGIKTAVKHSPTVESVITGSHEFTTLVENNISEIVTFVDTDEIAKWLLSLDLKENELLDVFGNNLLDGSGNPDYGKLVDALSHDSIVSVLDSIIDDGTAAKSFLGAFVDIYNPMGDSGLIAAMGGYFSLVDKYADMAELVDYIGVGNLLDALEKIGYDLFDNISTDTVFKYIKVSQIIDAAGGIDKFLAIYDTNDLAEVVKAIGTDNIRKLIQDNNLLDAIDVKQVARDVLAYAKENSDTLKAALKEIGSAAYRVLMTKVDTISINGVNVFYGARFDLNNILISVLKAFPEKLSDIVDNGLSLSAALTIKESAAVYNYGISVSFTGEKDNLRNLLEGLDDNFNFKFSADADGKVDIELDVALPMAVSSIYETLLTTEKLSENVRQKLLKLPASTLGDMGELFESIAKDDELYNTLNEKLEDIRAKAYEKIDSTIPANAALDKAKAKVDELLAKLSDRDEYNALVDKAVGYFNTLAKGREGKQLLEALYEGNGLFSGTVDIEGIDIISVIEKVVNIPNKVEALFKNTVFTGKLNADITLSGIRKVTFTDLDGTSFTTMLAEGMELNILSSVTGYTGTLVTRDTLTGAEAPITHMPSEDVEIFAETPPTPPEPPVEKMYITFTDKDGKPIRSDVEFPYNTSEEDIIKYVQREFKKDGYTVNIGVGYDPTSENQTVKVIYTANIYYITWYEDESCTTAVDTLEWSFDNIPDLATLKSPDLPARRGYLPIGWVPVLTEDSFKTAGDISVYAVWEKQVYTATFAGHEQTQTVEFTIDDVLKGYIAEPEVPYKYGHEGKWQNYVLDCADITINAEYTLKEYTATFVADGEVVGTTTFTVEDTELTEPPVPEKNGYIGEWEDYEITDSDIVINAVYTAVALEEEDDGINPLFLWIGLILVLLIVAGGIFGYFKMSPKPEPEPEAEPEVEPEAEPEPEVEELIVPVVDEVSADEVNDLMADSTAMKLITLKATGAGAGMRAIVNLDKINDAFSAGETVTLDALKQKGIVPAKAQRVKILANGKLDKALNIEADSFSVEAVKMITLTGGTVTQTVAE